MSRGKVFVGFLILSGMYSTCAMESIKKTEEEEVEYVPTYEEWEQLNDVAGSRYVLHIKCQCGKKIIVALPSPTEVSDIDAVENDTGISLGADGDIDATSGDCRFDRPEYRFNPYEALSNYSPPPKDYPFPF